MTRFLVERLRIEAESIEVPAGTLLLLVYIGLIGLDSPAAQTADRALILVGPATAIAAAVISARDAEVMGDGGGTLSHPSLWKSVVPANLYGLGVLAAVLLTIATVGFGPPLDGTDLRPTIGALPAWSAMGAATGLLARSRPAAVALTFGAIAFGAVVLNGAQNSTPLLWSSALVPIGTETALRSEDVVGFGPLPQSVVLPASFALWSGLALVLARRRGTQRRSELSRARIYQITAIMIFVVATAGGPYLNRAIPWRLSPVWIVDTAQMNTPESVVQTAIRSLKSGMPEDRLAVSGDLEATMGPVMDFIRDGAPIALRSDEERFGPVVSLRYSDRSLVVCMSRTFDGWKIAHLSMFFAC